MDEKLKQEKAKIFVEHIEKHLDNLGAGKQDVICKICNKTIDEVWDAETKKEFTLFIQPGIYEEKRSYIDRNGTPFYITSGSRS